MFYIRNLRAKNVALKVPVQGINPGGVSHKMLLIEEGTRVKSESV